MKTLILILLAISSCVLYAQDNDRLYDTEMGEEPPRGDFGVGLGLDYGGIGARFGYAPVPKVAFLGGLGYNLNGLGVNAGVIWRMFPLMKATSTLGVLYGYNGVIVVEGASQYNKTYYGPSITVGLEYHSRVNTYFNLELLLPFRPQQFTDDWNALTKNGAVQVKNNPLPLAFSIGYHLKF
jgi:hypothetical protein